jgi:hypothetical protein
MATPLQLALHEGLVVVTLASRAGGLVMVVTAVIWHELASTAIMV